MPDTPPDRLLDKKKYRIKFGILESFILIFSLFVGGGLFMEYRERVAIAHQQAEQLFHQSTKSVQTELSTIHNAITNILYSSFAYHQTGLLNSENIQTANTIFIAHMQQYPFITSINSGDGAGNGYLLLHTDEENKIRIKTAQESGIVTWLTLDSQGKIKTAEKVHDDYDPRNRPWYKNSIHYKEIIWSAPYQFRTTGDIGITASLWLGNQTGHDEVVGVDIMLKDLSRFLSSLTIEKGMEVHLFDVDGTMIASSNQKYLSSRLQEKDSHLPRLGLGEFPFLDNALKAKDEKEEFWSFTDHGEKFLALMEPVSFTPGGKFNLLLTAPEEAFIPPFARDALWQMIIALLILTTASCWYIYRFLLPLRKIDTALRELGAGHFTSLPVDLTRNDEIGDLAANFVEMTESLHSRDELLRESDERLQSLGDNLPESYVYRYSYDAEGKPRFLYVSAGVETVHGVSREEVLRDGMVLNRQIPQEERQTLVAGEELSRKTMSDFQMTLSICRADGEKRWLLLCSRPHQNAAGQIIWDGVATDISRRYQVELALIEQRKFAENLIESSVPATFVLDAGHNVLIWNKACEELTGIKAESLVGSSDHWKAFYEQPHPCLADIALESGFLGLAANYDNYAHSGLAKKGLHAEGWYKNLNGHDRYLFFDAAPVYDSSGKIIAAIETLLDQTELKESESSLRLQSTALQAAANAIVITNRLGIIEWVNPAFSELTGYRSEEALGKSPSELVKSGFHDQAFYKELWATLLRGELWRGEMTNRHKDGTFYPEGQTITPVKDADGNITHFIAIKRDLREQRKLEEQLRQSQKMEALGTLAGGIAHDFNNILTAISGYGQLSLAKITADDPVRSNIDSMLEAVDRAVRLTQQMLMFSRKQTSYKKTIELNTVITNVKKFLQRVIGEDITIISNLQTEPIYLQADDQQLEQVLMNLATNASHAMPQGGTLTLTTETVELNHEFASAYGYGTPGAHALITVTDTGNGMDQETLSRIFEPFFTTKDVGKGTGLGLAVAYGIIKNHMGYIDVASAPELGTSFLIYLPLSKETLLKETTHAPAAINGGSETILLAEDDKLVREMISEMLRQHGYTVISVENGVEAVHQFTEQNAAIDLLLFDLIMPKMNGQEALEEIRKVRPEIKAIFSSGYAPETIHQKLKLADNVHLIPKPSAPNDLLRMVRSVLDQTK